MTISKPRTTPAAPVRPALPALIIGAASMALSGVAPLLGPLLVALLVGAVIANTHLAGSRTLAGHATVTKTLLRCGVVLLGLQISGTDLAAVGVAGITIIVSTVACTYAITQWLGRRLQLDRDLVTLVAAGFSICGAAAIAAVNDAVQAKERNVGLAVALVTLFGSVMIVGVPSIGRLLGLTDEQTAIWAGASIHEVAQVAAAASILGGSAVAAAMTVKLGRVLLLAPVYAAASRGSATPGGARAVPWFVIGFAAAVAVRSTGMLPEQIIDGMSRATTLLLAAGMFGLGLGIRVRELWPIPRAVLILATVSTLVASSVSLGLVVALV